MLAFVFVFACNSQFLERSVLPSFVDLDWAFSDTLSRMIQGRVTQIKEVSLEAF